MSRLAPLTGVAFLICLILGFMIAGEPPDADEPVQEIVSHYTDDKDSIMFGAILQALAAVFLVFFANHLRTVVREAATSATVLVGASIVAVAAGIDATISFSLAEAAEDVDPSAVQALQALWDHDFVPFAIGIVVFLVSVGLAVLRTGALPKWLGWAALALALVGLTPIGFAAFLGTAVWILIVSVLLSIRAGSSPAPPTADVPPAQ